MGAVCPHAPAFVPGASRHAARRGATFGTPSQLQKRRRFWRKGGSRCRSSPKRRPPLFPLGSEHIDPAQFRPFGDELGSHGAKVGLGSLFTGNLILANVANAYLANDWRGNSLSSVLTMISISSSSSSAHSRKSTLRRSESGKTRSLHSSKATIVLALVGRCTVPTWNEKLS